MENKKPQKLLLVTVTILKLLTGEVILSTVICVFSITTDLEHKSYLKVDN